MSGDITNGASDVSVTVTPSGGYFTGGGTPPVFVPADATATWNGAGYSISNPLPAWLPYAGIGVAFILILAVAAGRR